VLSAVLSATVLATLLAVLAAVLVQLLVELAATSLVPVWAAWVALCWLVVLASLIQPL
jgi:hypothetical protein